MCEITIYEGKINDENKLLGRVNEYELDMETGELEASQLLGEVKRFRGFKELTWSESNDAMVLKYE